MPEVDLTHWKPRAYPAFEELVGRRATIVPSHADRDGEGLFLATGQGDPALWNYLPYGPFERAEAFASWFHHHVNDANLLPVTILENTTREVLGCASYMRVDRANGVLEIGHIMYGSALQRTATATEVIFLMLSYAFDELGYRRVEWKCDAANARSRRAAERFGFVPEGVFRQHSIVKGRNRDTAWFSIIDQAWTRIRAGFTAWLDDANFDTDGRQLATLEALR
jgi:RimJ/RimL family protein N-acetyltransferase